MALALEGIRVIDVSQVAAVPMAARFLADFGAEVLHIEHPVRGDMWRAYQAGVGGTGGVPSKVNYAWETYNRNKKSVTIDLSREAGQKVLYRLVEKADVFITNLRPFEQEEFRVEYETLNQINPRLIYGSLTGYGNKGPERNAPGYDSTGFYARSGMVHMLRSEGQINIFRPAFGDNAGAMSLFAGIMTALYAREKTGVGQRVDVSLFQTGVYQLSFDVACALVTGQEWNRPPREDLPNPLEMGYFTKDGRWLLLVCVQPDRYWSQVCRAIGREDLEHDPRFDSLEARAKNHRELLRILDEVFASRTIDEWNARLEGIPHALAQNLAEVVSDPQARANGFFVPVDHPAYGRIEVMANPLNLSQTPATVRTPAPEFSQHTEEVLLENGYTWEDIARLKEQRIIA